MKKYIAIIAYAFSVAMLVAACVFLRGYGTIKENRLHDKAVAWRMQRQIQKQYDERHQRICYMDTTQKVAHQSDAWYEKYHVIRHAGGGIDGKCYSNTKEAFDLSYERGNRVFDVDLAYTSDGYLVLRHNWSDNLEDDSNCAMTQSIIKFDRNGQLRYFKPYYQMSLDEFLHTKPYGKYTPMTCEDLIQYMTLHEDAYMVLDMKDDMVSSYKYFWNMVQKMNHSEVMERVIVSVYDTSLYDSIMVIYPFKYWMIRQHYIHERNYSELLCECQQYNIPIVNISACYVDDEGVQWLRNAGIYTYVAVCDYESDMILYLAKGIYGAISNNLDEKFFNNANE